MLWHDVRYALRLMRRSPGFTAVAVLSLALGIGANTAIFSLFNTILLRTLPVDHPEQLVELLQKYPGEPRGNGWWSWASYEHFRDNNHVYSALTGTTFDNLLAVQIPNAVAENLVGENVPGNYFHVLGLRPAMGRLIGREDVPAGAGRATVAVVSWSYWDVRLHRDPAVLGRRLLIGGTPVTIIGVAPPGYTGPRLGVRTDIWMPREKQQLAMFGRLKPGATLQQARAELPVLYRFTIEERTAHSNDSYVRQMTAEVDSAATGFATVRDRYGKPLVLLMAVVGLLLLLACINMASMLLARSAGRQREMAVRVGLGAGRGRLLAQMLTESVLLSGAGTLVGVLLAYFGTRVLVRIIASGRAHERIVIPVAPDLRLLLFTAAIAVLTGVLFGLAPAWYSFFSAPASPLRQAGRSGETRFWRLFGKSLVATEVALSILLLSAAGLFLGHLSRMRNLDLGFRSDHVLLANLDPPRAYRREQLAQPYQTLLARLQAIPGVRSVSICGCSPIQGCGAARFVFAEGFQERPEERRYTSLNWVAPRHFETLGTPFLAGRDFRFEDAGRPRVAIINQAMARYYFPGVTPIGKHVTIDPDPRSGGWTGDQPYEVVGVVGDAKYEELREPAPRTMYLNMFQEGRVFNQFELRTAGDPESVTGAVRLAVREVLKNVTIGRVTTLYHQVDSAIVPERLIAMLSEWFGGLGAALAGIGLYGLLAYTVARRTNEIGVRLALGATAGGIIRMVLVDALAMVLAGLAVGVPLVLWSRPFAARLVDDLRVTTALPMAFGAAAVLAIAVLASYLPARRAARVDPMEALRHE